jgi:hypothetical protein
MRRSNRTLVGLATLALLLGITVETRADIVTNGGFETGDFTGWTATGPISVSSNSPLDGKYDAVFAQATSFSSLSQTITLTPGTVYICRSNFYTPAPAATRPKSSRYSLAAQNWWILPVPICLRLRLCKTSLLARISLRLAHRRSYSFRPKVHFTIFAWMT